MTDLSFDHSRAYAVMMQGRRDLSNIVRVIEMGSTHENALADTCREVLKQDSDNIMAIRLLSWVLIRDKNFLDAISVLNKAIVFWPDFHDLRFELLRCHIMIGDCNPSYLSRLTWASDSLLSRISYGSQFAFKRGFSNSSDRRVSKAIDCEVAGILRSLGHPDEAEAEPYSPVFTEFVRLIAKSKSIAIVGNAASLRGKLLGASIDKCDLVIRCNLAPIEKYIEDVGTKTDFIAANESLLPNIEELSRNNHFSESLNVLLFHPASRMIHPTSEYSKIGGRIGRISYSSRVILSDLCYSRMTTGLMVVIFVVCIMRKHVNVYGMDFYAAAEKHYFGGSAPPFLGHEIHYERWFAERFVKSIWGEFVTFK